MGRGMTAVFLALVLFCGIMFSGCASVPKEVLDEKEAVIQNLNVQIEGLKDEISRLQQSNEELLDIKSELERKLEEKERAQLQKGAEEESEPKIK